MTERDSQAVHNVDSRRATTLERAAVTVDELLTIWPRLTAALLPGTHRRWTEQQQEVDEDGNRIPQPAEERCPDCRSVRLRKPDQPVAGTDKVLPGKPYCPLGCDDSPDAPGYTRSPVADDALSVLVSVGTDLAWLEDNVRETLGFTALDEYDDVHEAHRHRLGVGRLAGRDPIAAATWIRDALPTLTEHVNLANHVAGELARMSRTIRRSLGDVEDIHPIKAPCPICECMSLRAFPERELIICIHENCRCDAPDCPCTTSPRYRHRWSRDQWPWLAEVLGVELEQAERAG